jgi:apolipoprotein N-acyltransferase
MGTDNDEQLVHLSTSSSKAQSNRRSWSLLILGTLLVALTLPSLHVSLPARTDTIFDFSPLGVACALPSVHKGQHPTLSDFITETRKLTSQAKVVLWPESAVVFNSQEEREAAFEELRKDIQKSVIGVAFEEFLPENPSNPGESRMRRNGLALVQEGQEKGKEVIQYYKRNLVPFTESFSGIPSTEPPAIFNFELGPPKWATKSEWSSTPNHTRPVTITSSICLDFAFSSAFTPLDSRPALILAPARTWDSTISLAMWEQAKSRANEIGSMVLWCDGGATGVSGVGGGGISEIMQIGSGSWTRTIGLQFPFDQRRTVYAVVGDFGVLVLLVAIMGGGSVAWHLPALSVVLSGGRSVLQAVPLLRRLLPGRQRDQENLIDAAVPGERQSLLH